MYSYMCRTQVNVRGCSRINNVGWTFSPQLPHLHIFLAPCFPLVCSYVAKEACVLKQIVRDYAVANMGKETINHVICNDENSVLLQAYVSL